MKTTSHNEPRQMYLDTLLEFHKKMGLKEFWVKPPEARDISLSALIEDYARTNHENKLEQDAISLESAIDEYHRRELYVLAQLAHNKRELEG